MKALFAADCAKARDVLRQGTLALESHGQLRRTFEGAPEWLLQDGAKKKVSASQRMSCFHGGGHIYGTFTALHRKYITKH